AMALGKTSGSTPFHAFETPSLRVGGALLGLGLAAVYLPLLTLETFGGQALAAGTLLGTAASLAAIAWAFDAARRFEKPVLAGIGATGLLALAGAISVTRFGLQDIDWLPAIWTGTALTAVPVLYSMRHAERSRMAGAALEPMASSRALSTPLSIVALG